jgi:hypothetical protein
MAAAAALNGCATASAVTASPAAVSAAAADRNAAGATFSSEPIVAA